MREMCYANKKTTLSILLQLIIHKGIRYYRFQPAVVSTISRVIGACQSGEILILDFDFPDNKRLQHGSVKKDSQMYMNVFDWRKVSGGAPTPLQIFCTVWAHQP
jgi:hypothetical protein